MSAMDMERFVDAVISGSPARLELAVVMLFSGDGQVKPAAVLTPTPSGKWPRKPVARLLSPTQSRGNPDEDVALVESFAGYLRHRYEQTKDAS